MAERTPPVQAWSVADSLIERRELEALLFNVADIAAVMKGIDGLLFPEEDDDEDQEADEG